MKIDQKEKFSTRYFKDLTDILKLSETQKQQIINIHKNFSFDHLLQEIVENINNLEQKLDLRKNRIFHKITAEQFFKL